MNGRGAVPKVRQARCRREGGEKGSVEVWLAGEEGRLKNKKLKLKVIKIIINIKIFFIIKKY